jgi:hypothetical protein
MVTVTSRTPARPAASRRATSRRATSPPPPAGRGEAGFNFIEVLVSVGLLFLIAMMVLPIFSRAANLNLLGRESTVVASHGRTVHEELAQLPFAAPRLTVTAGSELTSTEMWVPETVTSSNPADPLDPALGEWVDPSALSGRQPVWQRDVRVRQFSINDLSEDGEFDNPLPASTDPNFVHLKEVQIEVQGTRAAGGPMGRSKSVVITRLKAF